MGTTGSAPDESATESRLLRLSDGTVVEPAILASVVESPMDAILALDDEQRIVLFNPGAEAMFRCPASEAIGEPLDRFVPMRFHANHRRLVHEFGETGSTSRGMGHLRPLAALRADGVEFPIEATISQVSVEGRHYYAAIVRDISRRQAAERALQRQASLLDLAYDAIFTWDLDGPITFWNRGAEALYGYLRDEAVGCPSHELLKTRHQDGFASVRDDLLRRGVWEGEVVHRRSDGTEVLVESRHVLVHDADGAYVLEVNRDISERKLAEVERTRVAAQEAAARAEAEAAQAERDRLYEILDRLPSGVMILSIADGMIEFANAAFGELTSLPVSAVDALPVYGRDFVFLRADGTPLPTLERPSFRVMRGERVANQQLMLERHDGSHVAVSAYAGPMHDEHDRTNRVIVLLQDVSQLRQAEQLKDDFLALISHEFRTPLTAIHGGAHMLAREGDALDDETRAELLADVGTESERLDRMLGNILTLANVMAGRLPVETEPVLLAPLVKRVVAAVSLRETRHQFVIDVPAEIPPVEADPGLLEQVLRNLYENALKYAPHGGEIRTLASVTVDGVAIQVCDQGIGISSEHVRSVFERFRRVGGDPTVRGMGLGLYLSRHLVEAQHGTIAASSDGPGRGSEFTVTLPVAVGWSDLPDESDAGSKGSL